MSGARMAGGRTADGHTTDEAVHVLCADWVITMDGESSAGDRTALAGVLDGGAVALRGSTIAGVGPAAEVRSAHPGATVEHLGGHVLLPGLVNAHSHLAMAMFRGIADDRDLEAFLATVVPLESSMLDEQRVHAAVRAAMVESHLAGVTTVLDMYFFCDAALSAARECGGRVLTGPVLLDGPAPDDPAAEPGAAPSSGAGARWARRTTWAGSWLEAHPREHDWVPVLGPHATYTVSPDHLREVAELADRTGALVHIHAAETAAEIDMVAAAHGRRPVELLDDLGLLRRGTVLAHAVHLTDAEVDRLAATGTAVVHCPASNLKLASGVAPVRTLLARGVTVALGTDGPATSNDLDLLAAARLAALTHKTVAPEGPDAASLAAGEVLAMATRGGAAAVGLEGRLGVLRAGARADLVAIDLSRAHTQPVYDPCSAVVYAAGRGDVREVWSNGRRVVAGGRHTMVEERDVVDDLRSLGELVRASVT